VAICIAVNVFLGLALLVVGTCWLLDRRGQQRTREKTERIVETLSGELEALRAEYAVPGSLQPATLPPAPRGLGRRVVAVTRDDAPEHTRATVVAPAPPDGRESPGAWPAWEQDTPSGVTVVSDEGPWRLRYAALMAEAEDLGLEVFHCGSSACGPKRHSICGCSCKPCVRATDLFVRSRIRPDRPS